MTGSLSQRAPLAKFKKRRHAHQSHGAHLVFSLSCKSRRLWHLAPKSSFGWGYAFHDPETQFWSIFQGACPGRESETMRELMSLEEWSLACLKGTLASSLRPGSIRKVSLQQFDGFKRRVQTSYGVGEEKIKQTIAAAIDASPNCDSERAAEIRRRYLDN
jgi:hypothetical protein